MGLLKPKWMSKSEKKALLAVEEISEQSILRKVAQDAPLLSVNRAAIEKMTIKPDLELLAKYGKGIGNKDSGIIERAARDRLRTIRGKELDILTDQDEIARFIILQNDYYYFSKASERLTDKEIIGKIARDSKDTQIGAKAVERLTDQSILADIAIHGKNKLTIKAAEKKVRNNSLVIEIAKKGKSKGVGDAAYKRLSKKDKQKVRCEHEWEEIGSGNDPIYGDPYNVYKCKICGLEKTVHF